jgi:hypothetical protein
MNANPEDDFSDEEWQQIFIERTETSAEWALNTLCEFEQYERVRRIMENIAEKLPKRIT